MNRFKDYNDHSGPALSIRSAQTTENRISGVTTTANAFGKAEAHSKGGIS